MRPAIFDAIESGDQNNFQVALAASANPLVERDNLGRGPLHCAAIFDRPAMLRALLNLPGADVNMVNRLNETPLHKAAEKGSLNSVRVLLLAGANVGAINFFKNCALHFAAKNGKFNIVSEFISAGAVIDVLNRFNKTALHEASEYGSLVCVRKLLAAGSNKDALDSDGNTPLCLAIIYAHFQVAIALVKAGANMEIINKDGKKLSDLASKVEQKKTYDDVRKVIQACNGGAIAAALSEGGPGIRCALAGDVIAEYLASVMDLNLISFADLDLGMIMDPGIEVAMSFNLLSVNKGAAKNGTFKWNEKVEGILKPEITKAKALCKNVHAQLLSEREIAM